MKVSSLPRKGKVRKPGTGCIYRINNNFWEGSYTPRFTDSKRKKHSVYATTKDECEVFLADLLEEVKAEIQNEKNKLSFSMQTKKTDYFKACLFITIRGRFKTSANCAFFTVPVKIVVIFRSD
ncbi:MAG: hypothetical protein HFE30_08820 [Clostridiales bacterium]|nr:hypothetical protein [Clostridiales bacterium]